MNAERRALLLVLVAAAVYLLPFVNRGWIPSDDGLLAHSAERVLQGELPHRDFGDMYTGGLAFLHAVTMAVLGVKLSALRWLLYAATLIALPFLYFIAVRVTRPAVAALLCLAAVVWTVPNYFASMPSWYNLFLTLGALWALLRHVEDGRRRWLFLVGLAAGLSFAIKSSALLLIAAVFLFLVYREQQLDGESSEKKGNGQRVPAYGVFVTAGLGAFLWVLASFVSKMPATAEILHFFVPAACLCMVPLIDAWRRPGNALSVRLRRLLGLTAPFLGGLVTAAFVFILPYLVNGGFGALLRGDYLFVNKRLQFTYYALPRWETAVFVLPLTLLLLWPLWRSFRPNVERHLLMPVALGLIVAFSMGTNLIVYQSVWYSARPVPIAVSLAGSLLLIIRGEKLPTVQRQALFAVLTVSALLSLTQFPFARGIYLCYVAPLVLLSVLYLVRAQALLQENVPQRLHLVFLIFYMLFAAVWLNLSWVEAFETRFHNRVVETPLDLERAGLRLTEEEAENYRQVIETVQEHSENGSFIFAAPDCPEIYFLADRRNPTPSFYDYFEPDYGTPERTERLLSLLDERSIDVVVLCWRANFSELPDDFTRAVFDRFPDQQPIYPRFTVHWR